MYSTDNEIKSVFRTLKNKIYKHMIDVSKKVYSDVLDDIVDKYKNTFHRTIKMKAIDVKSDSCAEYNVYSNEKGPKFKTGDHVRISKCKNIFTKLYAPNWSDVFVISNIKKYSCMDIC